MIKITEKVQLKNVLDYINPYKAEKYRTHTEKVKIKSVYLLGFILLFRRVTVLSYNL